MDMISTAEAAVILNLSPRRVRQLRAALGAVEIGGTLAFPRRRVEAESLRDRPKPGPRPKKKKSATPV